MSKISVLKYVAQELAFNITNCCLFLVLLFYSMLTKSSNKTKTKIPPNQNCVDGFVRNCPKKKKKCFRCIGFAQQAKKLSLSVLMKVELDRIGLGQ